MSRTHHDRTREEIRRALAVAEARLVNLHTLTGMFLRGVSIKPMPTDINELRALVASKMGVDLAALPEWHELRDIWDGNGGQKDKDDTFDVDAATDEWIRRTMG